MKIQRGFTLIELMIVVAIIAILAAFVVPAYTNYINKSRRSDGITALHKLQLAQEKYRANCRTYAESLADDDNNANNDSVCNTTSNTYTLEFDTTSPEGYYTLAITTGTATGNAYTATADGSASVQDRDKIEIGGTVTDCSVLTLAVSGTNPEGVKTPAECW